MPRPNVRNVLLVDDEESVRAATEACLEAIGVTDVKVADSGESGLAMLANHKPSVLLLDLLMPGTDGFAVLRKIRGLSPDQRPERVIVMSAIDAGSVAASLLALGADAVLPKPFHLNDLRAVLREGR